MSDYSQPFNTVVHDNPLCDTCAHYISGDCGLFKSPENNKNLPVLFARFFENACGATAYCYECRGEPDE